LKSRKDDTLELPLFLTAKAARRDTGPGGFCLLELAFLGLVRYNDIYK